MLATAGLARGGVLEGAARLQETLAGGVELGPVLPEQGPTGLLLGLETSLGLRSNRLTPAIWNRYAGRHLDEEAKRSLLKEVGGSLAWTAASRVTLLEGLWRGGDDSRWGGVLEQVASASGELDLSLLRVALLGNDPEQALVVRQASGQGEVLHRARLAWSRPLPASWTSRLGLQRLDGGLGLFLEQGGWLTRTHSFQARAEPPQGQVSALFEHVQEEAGPGTGWGLDFGLAGRLSLAGHPLTLQAALRGLSHVQTWRQVRRSYRRFELPQTPVDVTFDYEAFSVELLDSSWVRSSHDLHLSRRAGWLASADWQAGPWRHSLLAEQIPEDARGAGLRRLSLASRFAWRACYARLECTGGAGSGPALGGELGWAGSRWTVGVGGTGYAGLGSRSRGGQVGLECRWRLP